jgi:hypothetical protein
MNLLSRRSVFIGGVMLLTPFAAFGSARLWCQQVNLAGANPNGVWRLTALFHNIDAIRKLGRRYLDVTQSSALESVGRVAAQTSIMQAAATGCAMTTRQTIEAACQDDFRYGRVQCVDGWIMAQTELDVAACFLAFRDG